MNTIYDYLLSPIEKLPNVGDTTKSALHRLGCFTFADLLFHFPTNFIAKILNPKLQSVPNGTSVVLDVVVHSESPAKKYSKVTSIECETYNNNAENYISLVFFNRLPTYTHTHLHKGNKIVASGELSRNHSGHLQIVHPSITQSIDYVNKIDVVYPLTYAITSYKIHKLISHIMRELQKFTIPEWLDSNTLLQNRWVSFLESLHSIHNPKSINDLSPNNIYKTRLAFDNFIANQFAIKLARKYKKLSTKGQELKFNGALFEKLLQDSKFSLTDGQKHVLTEIIDDQKSPRKMVRLLQGDVGSGKTFVALCAILNTIESNRNAVFMAPTDILANQHFISIKNFLKDFDITIEILTGKTTAARKRKILQQLENGEINILIGTHAIFQANVVCENLGIIIIDEQHKFGVQQRIALMDKEKSADILMMSATPIPRTLSLTVYGDMDVSIIPDKPKGRKPIRTSTILNAKIDQVIDFIKIKANNNEQVYWVCPAIEETETNIDTNANTNTNTNIDTKGSSYKYSAATKRYADLQKIFSDDVSLVHGKLKNAEKETVMENFINGNTKILVSTTVIEVGIDVPNATLLIIEQSERFGLAQLHQLRGRVGRGDLQSDCILLFSKEAGKVARSRLKTMKESNDGFYIAEQDLKLRGSGDIVGNKQSGLPSFKAADLDFHHSLLFDAKKYVDSHSNNQLLYNTLKIFGYDIKLGSA